MRMHNPPHPGKIIKALCLDPLGLTVTEAAEFDVCGAADKRYSLDCVESP